MDSFDKSQLDAFVKSPLDARNAPGVSQGIVLLSVLWYGYGATCHPNNVARFIAHQQLLTEALARQEIRGRQVALGLVVVLDGDMSKIWPCTSLPGDGPSDTRLSLFFPGIGTFPGYPDSGLVGTDWIHARIDEMIGAFSPNVPLSSLTIVVLDSQFGSTGWTEASLGQLGLDLAEAKYAEHYPGARVILPGYGAGQVYFLEALAGYMDF